MKLSNRVLLGISLICLPTIMGCAALKGNIDNYNTCMLDPVCSAKVSSSVQTTTTIAGAVSGLVGTPIPTPITTVVGLVTALLAGIYFGKKIKPKDPQAKL